MRKTLIWFVLMAVLMATPLAYAIDRDDELKSDGDEHIGYNSAGTSEESAQIEAKFPDEAQAVRAALEAHVGHANSRKLDEYLADFLAERVRFPEQDREYAKRAMALKDLKLSVKAIEFAALTRTAATVHTRQVSTYVDDSGKAQIDDAIISYRWIKDSRDGRWKIGFTERRRLAADDKQDR